MQRATDPCRGKKLSTLGELCFVLMNVNPREYGHAMPHESDTTDLSASQPGMVVIISGPSGVGKTTITHQVEARLDARFSVSLTTRARTQADTEGRDYHFVDVERFKQARDKGELLEWASVFEDFYGTPREPVVRALADGVVIILEIDVEGAIKIKQQIPHAYAIWVLPPSEDELLRRLRRRKREPEEKIQQRFSKAKGEIERAWTCGQYDLFVINRHVQETVDEATWHIMDAWRKKQAAVAQT